MLKERLNTNLALVSGFQVYKGSLVPGFLPILLIICACFSWTDLLTKNREESGDNPMQRIMSYKSAVPD